MTTRGTLRTWRTAVVIGWAAWPAGVIIRPTVNTVNMLIYGPVLALAVRQVVNDATGGRTGRATLFLAVLAAAPLVMGAVFDYTQWLSMVRVKHETDRRLLAAGLAPAGIAHVEDPTFADNLAAAREENAAIAQLLDWLAGAFADVLSISISLVILFAVHPVLGMLVIGAASVAPVHGRARRQQIAFMDKTLPGQRLAAELMTLGVGLPAAKDVRMLGLSTWLRERHGREAHRVLTALRASERRPVLLVAATGALQGALLAGGIALLVRLVADGRATPGDVALAISLLGSTLMRVVGFGFATADLARNTRAAERLIWLLDYQSPVERSLTPQPVPDRICDGLQLAGVSFGYPWADRPALSEVTLDLPAGCTVALVGENGAGKTTLVKLLCRFYDPSTGSISVDGVDLRELHVDEWRSALTLASQDFMRFEFTAAESIGVGDVNSIDDLAAIRVAAERAGADTFVSRLPHGFETQLGKQFEGGVELSEGQWQRLALARSSMRRTPLLVLLDEPTAALDPLAEESVFRAFLAHTESARQQGGITVLVSHRFSTVAMADRIVVLEAGRVTEVGSHTDLISAGNTYAEMYALQAARYR